MGGQELTQKKKHKTNSDEQHRDTDGQKEKKETRKVKQHLEMFFSSKISKKLNARLAKQ